MILALLILLPFTVAKAAVTADYCVVPMPRTVEMCGEGRFTLTGGCAIVYDASDSGMEDNAGFLREYVLEATGICLDLAPGREDRRGAIALVLDATLDGDEGYRILVTPDSVTISGRTPAGVFYGVQTLRKSLPVGTTDEVELPAALVADSPRFGYRGMMLDCARHFFPVETVKECIDLLAMHNMNRFHWHLSDDQGWRIEIRKYPLLTAVGSTRRQTTIGHNSQIYDGVCHGGYYTQEEAREVVEYARRRHVTVVPEIDMPGHQMAALAAYPELGCAGGPYEVGQNWGVYTDILCLGSERTYEFCQDVLEELMEIFPSDVIHIGGDEAPKDVTQECPRCQALMEREGLTKENVQGYFTNRIEKFVNSRGRRIMGWDEILEGDIEKSATIHCWRGAEHGLKAAMAGHDVVMSPTSYCYFDYYQADPTRYDEPQSIGGYVPVEKVFSMEPVPDGLPEEDCGRIVGVQCNLWTEYICSAPHVFYMLLPRMAALSEVQWCRKKGSFGEFLPRLTRLTDLYRLHGLPYARHLWPETLRMDGRNFR